MSGEDSKQLSVAELLARNGAQGGSPPSSGGGRRRRSGRGVSVTDLTGENAVIRPGGRSHAAPTETPPEPPAYEPPASQEPAPYPPPGPAEPAYSPPSGPITRLDPTADPLGLSTPRSGSDPFGPFRAEARDSTRQNGRLGVPGGAAQPVDPGIAEMFGSGALPAVGGGRRRKPDDEPQHPESPAPPPPVTGGRAARRRAAEAAEEAVEPPAPSGYAASLHESGIDAPRAFMGRPGQTPGFNAFPDLGFEDHPSVGPAPYEPPAYEPRAFDNGYAAPNGYPPPTQAFSPAPEAPADPRPSLERRRDAGKGGLPSWSARRHRPAPEPGPESGGLPTAAWSPISQEQPLLAGDSVAADLLRQRAEIDATADARTEVYRLDGVEPATDDYAESDYTDRDYADNDYSDNDYGDYDEYEDDDYEPEPKPSRASRRAATAAAAAKVAGRAKSRAKKRVSSSRARTGAGGLARFAPKGAVDDHRREWMMLGAQSVGAAIAGMLLFKGFETMWETLPWVALALAMVVILGLVALVRVLRRTDDIFSTVIAVIVGVFVTLGPLAFLLSTS
ncbi:hypothetical protein [Nocardia caishijiensis]|uniref:Uncharacterized protein n=1 Tax=Nocardia caishijiensis TaxID=184756 RepID=A0ABQ6YT20_9NOCA|nr:hypothetical protein [Nocardia caishijiensis]KAF0848957.1 hypothetical protein FNL39_101392 [Nocardia caishijiensis]